MFCAIYFLYIRQVDWKFWEMQISLESNYNEMDVVTEYLVSIVNATNAKNWRLYLHIVDGQILFIKYVHAVHWIWN